MKPTLATDSFAQKLLFYGIGAGALSAATTGHAQTTTTPVGQTSSIFYFTLQNTTASTTAPVNSPYFEFATGGSKTRALTGTNGTPAAGAGTNYMLATESKPGPGGAATNYVLKLGVGTTIGTGVFSTGGTFNNYYVNGTYGNNAPSGAKNGDWKSGDRGFVGLEITFGGAVHFGFADVTLNSVSPGLAPVPGAYTLNGLAYQATPKGAITTAFIVPEPRSTTALLVAGAAGALALRARRRKA